MKAVGRSLFAADSATTGAKARVAYERVSAADLNLPESWFRDAIFKDPELVIGPCREADSFPSDETWLPWATECSFGAGPVDVLLVSSQGRPAIIETKLSYNPGNRREVVAQLLDYALALQETSVEDLPPLPTSESAPDVADLQECLTTGRFLLIVAGDALDPRAVRLSEALLARHLTSEWDLAMVDLNVYRGTPPDDRLLIVPELRGVVLAETRQVVRVEVKGETPRARITVERIPSGDGAGGRRPPQGSVDAFLECVRQKSPTAVDAVSKIVNRFRRIEDANGDRFALRLGVATANLYWKGGTGVLRRIFAMRETGLFLFPLEYVLNEGREDIAAIIRDLSKPVVTIGPRETRGALSVDQNNVGAILSAMDAIVAAIAGLEP